MPGSAHPSGIDPSLATTGPCSLPALSVLFTALAEGVGAPPPPSPPRPARAAADGEDRRGRRQVGVPSPSASREPGGPTPTAFRASTVTRAGTPAGAIASAAVPFSTSPRESAARCCKGTTRASWLASESVFPGI